MAPSHARLTLATLPEEILQAIVLCLNAKSMINLGKTARRFAGLSNQPMLWKAFCQHEYQYWSSRDRFRQRPSDSADQDWKQVYADHALVSRRTHEVLDEIVRDPRGRSGRIQRIVEHGYEAKDALLQAFHDAAGTPDHLARRYWSHVALGCLHRSIALEEWTRIKSRTDVDHPIERALAAFDMFVLDERSEGDMDDVLDRLDSYVRSVQSAYPNLDRQTPRMRAKAVASHLHDRRWLGLESGSEFESLDNMFLGVALFSPEHNSLPLVSAVIYSYVARHFNLRVQPISYPRHVHVLVQPPEGLDLDGQPLDLSPDGGGGGGGGGRAKRSAETDLYMDPFHSAEPVAMSTLQQQLRYFAPVVSAAQWATFLSAATHRDLMVRCAHNILGSVTVDGRALTPPLSVESATYAALFALVFFPAHPANLRTQLTQLTQHFLHHYDHDLHAFRTHILPLTDSLPDHLAYRNLYLQLLRNDREGNAPKYRTPDPRTSATTDTTTTNTTDITTTDNATPTTTASSSPSVRYRVGQLFRHRRRNYLALIYGWDPSCEMTQQWIRLNQVDGLPRGRHQPFYNAFVLDDRSTRYVAEENVILLGPLDRGGNGETVDAAEVETWPIEIGKWMKRFRVQAHADDGGGGESGSSGGIGWSFESNVKDEYPDD